MTSTQLTPSATPASTAGGPAPAAGVAPAAGSPATGSDPASAAGGSVAPAAAPTARAASSPAARALRVAVVQAGLSNPSTTSRLADLLTQELASETQDRGTHAEMTRIDLRPLAVGIMESTVQAVKTQPVADALAAIDAADLLIAVSPTFNASYSGLFKAFFDLVEPKALAGVPVILGATGGTARHSLVVDMTMRPLFTYLRAMPVHRCVRQRRRLCGTAQPHLPRTTRGARGAGAARGWRNADASRARRRLAGLGRRRLRCCGRRGVAELGGSGNWAPFRSEFAWRPHLSSGRLHRLRAIRPAAASDGWAVAVANRAIVPSGAGIPSPRCELTPPGGTGIPSPRCEHNCAFIGRYAANPTETARFFSSCAHGTPRAAEKRHREALRPAARRGCGAAG